MHPVRTRRQYLSPAGELESAKRTAAAAATGAHCRRGVLARKVAAVGDGGGGGPQQPRQSLLGRPIVSRPTRRDVHYRRLQAKVYNFLERPKDYKAISYHLLVFLMVFICLLLSVFSTIEQYEDVAALILYYMELLMVVWFSAEFLVRIWSAGCRSRYQQFRGRIQFIRRPLCIVDVVVISASVVILCLGTSGKVFATSALRGLRFFQILRMVRVDRRGGSWKLLGSVVWAHRQELFTTLYIGFLGLIFSSFLMYLAEKDKNPKKFGTYADALWWGVITLCTVGYGDSVPTTWPGKLIAAFCAILGISFFALPAGILGSGFALKVQQQQRQKHLIRRKGPAAVLIQSLWRCYAADEQSLSVATWKIHLKPHKSQPCSQKFRQNSSFMSRLSTRRRDCTLLGGTNSLPLVPSPINFRRSILRRNPPPPPPHPTPPLPPPPPTPQTTNNNQAATDDKDTESIDTDRSHLSLFDYTGQHLLGSILKRTEYSNRDAEDEGDESEVGVVTQLTDVHKRAIRSIRKIRYFVAKRKFKEAFRPYDVKDVIEQYSAGNLDMLTRIKILQGKLDVILGRSGSKKPDVYESKISLASRIVKIERQVDDIEGKVDTMIDMFREDRERRRLNIEAQNQFQEGPAQSSKGQKNKKTLDVIYPPSSADNSLSSRRQLYVGDKLKSEPCTPILKNAEKPMFRNLSDLGPRIKKKVTYSRSTGDDDDDDYTPARHDHSSDAFAAETNRHRSSVEALPTFSFTHYSHPPCLPHQTSVVREEEEEDVAPLPPLPQGVNVDRPTAKTPTDASEQSTDPRSTAPAAARCVRTWGTERDYNQLDDAESADRTHDLTFFADPQVT